MTNYPLRLPDNVLADAKELARANGASLNHFLTGLIADRVGEMRALRRLEGRAARGDPAKALAILARAPDRPPLPGDELSAGGS